MSDKVSGIVRHNEKHREEENARVYTAREIFFRRVLFYAGIALWVLILLIPFSVVMLSIMGEYTIDLPGDYPESELRIWMVMERDERGVAYSRPQVHSRDETSLSVQSNVRYLLWEGENEAIRYCQNYTRASSDDMWVFNVASEGRCP